MRFKLLFRATLAALILAACGVVASAQTTQVEGIVTLDQVNKLDASGGASSGGGSAPADSKEAKAKREEMQKQVEEINKKNEEIKNSNEAVSRTFKAGNDALTAGHFDEAITSFKEGL